MATPKRRRVCRVNNCEGGQTAHNLKVVVAAAAGTSYVGLFLRSKDFFLIFLIDKKIIPTAYCEIAIFICKNISIWL